MSKNLSSVIAFVAGAAVGAFGMFIFMNDKVQQQINEVNSARDEYLNKNQEKQTVNEPAERKENLKKDDSKNAAEEIIRNNGYVSPKSDSRGNPVVIDPYECGDEPDYEQVELMYYSTADIVRDENNETLTKEEIEEDIGAAALRRFGEYEDDSVYVRNDSQERYYIILLAPEDED